MSTTQTIPVTSSSFTLTLPYPVSTMIGATIENESPYNLLVTSGGSVRNTPAQCLDYLVLPTTGSTIQVQPTLITPDAGGLISEAIVTWYIQGDTMPSQALPIALPRSLEIGGNVDIGTITGTVTVQGSVDVGSGTIDIGNTPTVTIGAGSSPIDISSGTVNIGGGQGGSSTNVSTQTPPEQLPGSPFSYSTTSTESNTSFIIDIPLSATTLGMVFSYNVPTGNQLVQITGNTSNTVYFSSYVSPLDYELVAVNGSLDTALTVKVYCGSSASGTAYISALAGEGAVNVTNNELQPVIVQGATVKSNIGIADNWLYPPDVITMGSNAVGNTGTPKYDQVVQGANSTGQPWDVVEKKGYPRVEFYNNVGSFGTASQNYSLFTPTQDITITHVTFSAFINEINTGGNGFVDFEIYDSNGSVTLAYGMMPLNPSSFGSNVSFDGLVFRDVELETPYQCGTASTIMLGVVYRLYAPTSVNSGWIVKIVGTNGWI